MLRSPRAIFLFAFVVFAIPALAQTAQTTQTPPRPTPPTRDAHTPGYVAAAELPDGTIPAASANGNFIIGAVIQPDGTLAWDAPPGDWTVIRFGYTPTGQLTGTTAAYGAGGLEGDKFNPAALDIEFDLPVVNFATPDSNCWLIW